MNARLAEMSADVLAARRERLRDRPAGRARLAALLFEHQLWREEGPDVVIVPVLKKRRLS